MGRLADLVLLNLLFLLCSLPVLTIGASIAALYQCCDDMAEGTFLSSFRDFSGAFRKYLKGSVKVWLVFLLTGCLLIFDLTFPVFLKKGGSMRTMLRESMLMAMRNFQYTLVMAVINIIPPACFMLGGGVLVNAVPLYLIVGFGLTAFVNTYFLRRCV